MEVFLVLLRCVRGVLIARRGAGGVYPLQPTMQMRTLVKGSFLTGHCGTALAALLWLELGQHPNVISKVVSDGMAARSCIRMAEDERVLVEAACGASLAAVYEVGLKKMMPHLTRESKVVVIVCGGKSMCEPCNHRTSLLTYECTGSNINLEMLAQYKKEYGIQQI
jgi:L-serine/L-threonine ammonia-lyase